MAHVDVAVAVNVATTWGRGLLPDAFPSYEWVILGLS